MAPSAPSPATAPGTRVPLRSIERSMTLSDDHWFMVAHVVLVRGATEELARHAPAALLQTFNRHPRMRLTLLKHEFATAQVHAPLASVDELTQRGLLAIKQVASADELRLDACRAFVQRVGHTPYDRYTQFPFRLHLWRDAASDTARLFVFADHYAGDGSSGSTVIHDVLRFAAQLSLEQTTPEQMPKEMVLRPGMYDAYMRDHGVLGPVLRLVGKLAGRALFSLMPPPAHKIAPNKLQGDFRLRDMPQNPSTMLFAQGERENLSKTLAKCRAEQTTFTGALCAAAMLGVMVQSQSLESEAFQLKWLVAANMRKRVGAGYEPDSVGSYSHVVEMGLPPVNVPKQSFWALARAVNKYTAEGLSNVPVMALGFIVTDQLFHRESDAKLLDNVPITGSTFNELDVSNLGKYEYSRSHAFRSGQSLAIESLHYVARLPALTSLCQVYATSLDHAGYAMSHHYDEATGKAIFDTTVAIMEASWEIDSTTMLTEVAAKFALAS